jgi:hypothetical protein
MKHMNRKGNILAKGKSFAMFILVIGVLLAVTGIVLGALRTSQTAGTPGFAGADAAANATVQFGAQLPTVGVIMGVSLIVVVVVGGILVLFKKKGGF